MMCVWVYHMSSIQQLTVLLLYIILTNLDHVTLARTPTRVLSVPPLVYSITPLLVR